VAKGKSKTESAPKNRVDDLAAELIKSLNKDHGERIAYNLSVDESPTHIKRWISTGSKFLDYIVANKRNGGLPEGRIIEIFGPPGTGKSHIALQLAKSTQNLGGIVVYIDTENGTSIENLRLLGIDVSKGFVFVETSCTEEVFSIAEKTIMKAKSLTQDIPITIIWDSVAATSPKAELLGDYDKDTIGLQARTISKGMRKITQIIGNQSVTFVLLNQTRTKIGTMYGDPTTTPGGLSIPFHTSVRIKLGAGTPLKDSSGEIYGIRTTAKTIKNKVSPPFRTAEFEIHFGVGIKEHEQLFDYLRKAGEKRVGDDLIEVGGSGGWKQLTVQDAVSGNIKVEKKFHKSDFDKVIEDPETGPYINDLLEECLVRTIGPEDIDFDDDSYVEAEAMSVMISENLEE